jgi:hypothetical protein
MSSFQSFGVNNSMMNLISGLSSSTLTQMHKDRDARVKEMQEQEDARAEGMSSMMGGLINPMMGVLGGQLGKSLFPWGGTPAPEQAVDPRAMATGPYGESYEPGENFGYGPKGWRNQSYIPDTDR